MNHKLYFILVVFLLNSRCKTPYLHITSIPESTQKINPTLLSEIRSLPSSMDIPYEIRTIRMYFHFFNNSDSTINYNHDQAPLIVKALLESANGQMRRNEKMNLPKDNATPVRDTYIRYELSNYQGHSGIFYHYHYEPKYFIKKGKKKNLYDRDMMKEYLIRSDSVLNVLVMPFDPKQIASGEQKASRTAIALGTTIKLPGLYQSNHPTWAYTGIFNHEVGHVLGLRHTWASNDGCDDTPLNDNCWNTNMDPPCDGLTSNNLMDYNAYQSAVTPCQIARMHATINNPGRQAHRLVKPDDCESTAEQITIYSKQKWTQPVKVSGDIVVKEGGLLYIRSHVLMAQGSSITIEKGGILVLENASLYNTCGGLWQGINLHSKGLMYCLGVYNTIKNISQ